MQQESESETWTSIAPLLIERPNRKRYIQIRNLILSHKSPSFPVRTEDLANVVKGREDVPLPVWATNRDFEHELETLIRRNHTVIICLDCDHIVGFLNYSPDKGNFKLDELMYVMTREKFSCQFCESTGWALVASELLRSGVKIEIPLGIRRTMQSYQEQKTPPLFPSAPTQNELFMDSILRRLYPFKPNESTDHILLGKNAVPNAVRTVQDFSASLADLAKRIPPAFYLRPIFNEEHRNVLGTVWDTVKKILEPEYAQFVTTAVGILPRDELTASAHLGREGQMAVIIRFGFFKSLYILNHLMLYLVGGVDNRQYNRELLIPVLRSGLSFEDAEIGKAMKKVNLAHQSEDEFWTIHAISNMQQEFAILHELGHLNAWLQKSSGEEVDNLLCEEGSAEFYADAWAIDLILKKGAKFHRLNKYLLALLWLFEYWHASATIKNGEQKIVRERWDRIYAQAASRGVHLGDKDISMVRNFIDCVLET
jgi:hypothetical protein